MITHYMYESGKSACGRNNHNLTGTSDVKKMGTDLFFSRVLHAPKA